MLAIIEHTRIPGEAKEIQDPASFVLQIRDAIFISHLQPWSRNHFAQFQPNSQIVRVPGRGALQSQKTDTVRVEWQILHETTDNHVPWISQGDEKFCFGEQAKHARDQESHGRVFIEMNAIADWLVQRGGHVSQIARSLNGQTLDWNRVESFKI